MATRQNKKKTSGQAKTWTIICLILVCICALFLRGFLLYEIYPLEYKDEIACYSETYALDPYFVSAVINTESHFDKNAQSPKGAIGLMQIMPDTGTWAAEKTGINGFTAAMLLDPDINIRIGCWYLNYLSQKFDGNMDKVLAGYNAGPSRVMEWTNEHGVLGDIPFDETANYLKKVHRNYEIYKGLYNEF